MNKKLTLLLLGLIPASFAYCETPNVAQPFSIQKDSSTPELVAPASDSSVDFFELAKKNQAVEPQKTWESSADTVNMSPYERSQYYFNTQNYGAYNMEASSQQLQNLERAKNRGAISKKQYDKGFSKAVGYPATNGGGLKFTLP
jgi:hypothetical protein